MYCLFRGSRLGEKIKAFFTKMVLMKDNDEKHFGDDDRGYLQDGGCELGGLLSHLVHLALEVGDDFTGDVVAQDLEQVNSLVGADVLVGRELDSLLDLLDRSVFWN